MFREHPRRPPSSAKYRRFTRALAAGFLAHLPRPLPRTRNCSAVSRPVFRFSRSSQYSSANSSGGSLCCFPLPGEPRVGFTAAEQSLADAAILEERQENDGRAAVVNGGPFLMGEEMVTV